MESRRDRRRPSRCPPAGRAARWTCPRRPRLPPPRVTSGSCAGRRRWWRRPPASVPRRHRSPGRRRGASCGRAPAAGAWDRPPGGSAAERAGGCAYCGDRPACALLRRSGTGGLAGLACLAANPHATVKDALALVGFGGTNLPHFSSDLADVLLVGALDVDTGWLGDVDRDALGHRVTDRVREPHIEDQRLALPGGAIAHTDQLELVLVPLADALDHVP